jgi:hypothetical protein
MNQPTARKEDSFERARAAFFGKVTVKSSPSAPATGTMAPQNEPPRETSSQLTAVAASS